LTRNVERVEYLREESPAGEEVGYAETESMGAIVYFLKDPAVFEPEVTHAMSTAFDDVCRALDLAASDTRGREAVAARVIELARRGERDPDKLRQRVLKEAGAR
jgi:hypothetical protein